VRRSSPLSSKAVSTSLMTSAVSGVSDQFQSMTRPQLSKPSLRALRNSSKHKISGNGCHLRILRSTLRELWNNVIRTAVDGCWMMAVSIPGERHQTLSSGSTACLEVVRPFSPLLSYTSYNQKFLGVRSPVTILTSMAETNEICLRCCALCYTSSLVNIPR
jgi:hypothetical protein